MTTEFLNQVFVSNDCIELNTLDPSDIKWDDAIKWTQNFRDKFGSTQKFNGQKVKGYFMSRGNIEDVLAQDGFTLQGIKLYIGYDENDVFRIIAVGVKGNNSEDYKVPENAQVYNTTSSRDLPTIGEVRPCPEWCGRANVLNQP